MYPVRVRIDLPELRAEQDEWTAWRNALPAYDRQFISADCRPNQVAPKPDWHGREAQMIGPGVIVFDGAGLRDYQIVNPKHLVIV